ncbi:MAG: SDR family oxidoreductase [Acidobacteria bacterium]|nr:SDR family oxidoreductase [Acidobacteriota bacterium]
MSLAVVTGGAGFIGNHLVRGLLAAEHRVVIIDNFSTGRRGNILDLLVRHRDRLRLEEGSVTDPVFVRRVVRGADIVFHLAAVPSVQKSVEHPDISNEHNITGTLNVLLAARDGGVRRVIYAASSSAYGDTPTLPKTEDMPPEPLSPYALTKLAGEQYCRIFTRIYGLETIALRYFNVFGPRQEPTSHYAAVVPRFITRMLRDEPPIVYGDGNQSRDFTFVDNVVRANLLAVRAPVEATGRVFNIACGERLDLNALVAALNRILGKDLPPRFQDFRPGDVMHSLADITLAGQLLGYSPIIPLEKGLAITVDWYRNNENRTPATETPS